jgi:multicomponent Na+:H+ antiporter subunit G
MMTLGAILLGLGALVLLLAGAGLFVLRDALSRQHAATKAGTLGVAGIVLGAALVGGDWAWIGRALAIIVILWLTMPVASHVLARAALRSLAGDEDARIPLIYPPKPASRSIHRQGKQ